MRLNIYACYPAWMLAKPNGVWHFQKRLCCNLQQQRSQFWCGLWQILHTLFRCIFFAWFPPPPQLWNLFGLQMCIICLNYVLGLTFSICSPLFLRGGRRGLMGLYHCRRFSFWSLGELQNFRFLFLHSANIHVGRACCIFPILLAYSSCINIMWKFCYWMPKWHSILDEFSKKIGG